MSLAGGILLFLCAISAFAQEPDTTKGAAAALGVDTLKSLRFVGLGATFSVGQSPAPAEPWPRVTLRSYDTAINYETEAMRVKTVSEQGAVPRRGGGRPFDGQRQLIQVVKGNSAWDVPLMVPPARGGRQGGFRASTEFVEQPPVPQIAAAPERMQQIWLTPQGFVRAAMRNNATTRAVASGTEVSFTVSGRYRFVGIINRNNLVEQVHTWVENPVLGDMLVETHYSDYESVDGGFSFPMRITQKQGGHPSLDVWVFSVEPNFQFDVSVPESVRAAAPPPVRADLRKIGDGVYHATGGTHHSVVIEMGSNIVVVEGPGNEDRSLAVLAKIKETIPGKPVRFVVNTHHHFDHSGGLRTYANAGATIVTHETNRSYYEKAWAVPRTLAPDGLARSGKTPTFETFADKYMLSDGGRTLEVHRILNSPHDEGFAMVYLPSEKILIEADAYTPSADTATPAAALPSVNPTTCNLFQNIRRLGLDVLTIVPLHGTRLATMADLVSACGHK